MIRVTCSCGKELQAKEDWAGKKAKCTNCGRLLIIPAAAFATSRAEPVPTSPPQPGVTREDTEDPSEGIVKAQEREEYADLGIDFASARRELSERQRARAESMGNDEEYRLALAQKVAQRRFPPDPRSKSLAWCLSKSWIAGLIGAGAAITTFVPAWYAGVWSGLIDRDLIESLPRVMPPSLLKTLIALAFVNVFLAGGVFKYFELKNGTASRIPRMTEAIICGSLLLLQGLVVTCFYHEVGLTVFATVVFGWPIIVFPLHAFLLRVGVIVDRTAEGVSQSDRRETKV